MQSFNIGFNINNRKYSLRNDLHVISLKPKTLEFEITEGEIREDDEIYRLKKQISALEIEFEGGRNERFSFTIYNTEVKKLRTELGARNYADILIKLNAHDISLEVYLCGTEIRGFEVKPKIRVG